MKYASLALCFASILLAVFPPSTQAQVQVGSDIRLSPSSIIGVNHIGISVQNLDDMLAFYQSASGFELVKRERVTKHPHAEILLGVPGISYESAILKAPNMLLELTEYSDQENADSGKMPPQGPGMTHTCYQSPSWKSGYERFKGAGADVLSRGEEPVDLGGYGVTYAYVYDPEGNMLELEQLEKHVLNRSGWDSVWLARHHMWMTQVALISPDLKRMVDFYQKVLAIPPAREGSYSNRPRMDDVINVDQVALDICWFDLDRPSKMLELMQYKHPKTPSTSQAKSPTDLGYSFSLEVEDIQEEYKRLKGLGVTFLSEPHMLGEFWMVFANDVDGNVFSLRQPISTASPYSLKNFDSILQHSQK